MKTSKLIVDYDYDFDVLVLRASVKGYKLAWLLNKELQIDFYKAEDIRFDFLNDSFFSVTNYLYETDYSSIRLIRNKAHEFNNTNKPFLLPEFKDYDYILQLSGELKIFEINELLMNLKKLPEIELIQQIDIEQLKSKENLIF